MDKIGIIIEQLFKYLILTGVSYHYFSSKYSPQIFLLQIFAMVFWVKDVFEDTNCGVQL